MSTEAARHEVRFEHEGTRFVARCSLIAASSRFSFRMYRMHGRSWVPMPFDYGYVPTALYHTLAKFERMDGAHSRTGMIERMEAQIAATLSPALGIVLASQRLGRLLRVNLPVARRLVERWRPGGAGRILTGCDAHLGIQAVTVGEWLDGPKEARLHYDMTGRHIARHLLDST